MTKSEERIEHVGTVSAIDGQTAIIMIEQNSACGSCRARSMCGTSEHTDKQVEAIATQPLEIGQTVNVWGQQQLGLKAVLLAFVMPLILLVASLITFNALTGNEALAGTLALTMLLPWCGLLYLMRKRLKREFIFYAEPLSEHQAYPAEDSATDYCEDSTY